MTNTERLQTELDHLIWLMAPPYLDAWRPYCWAKANAMADADPEVFAQLPRMLKEAMQTVSNRSTSTAGCSGVQEKSDAR